MTEENAVEKPHVYHKPAKIKLEYDIEPPKEVLEVSDIDISPDGGQSILLDSFSLSVRRADRVGIIGANGAGKSTILKTILGILPHSKGRISWAQNVRTAYFDQKNEQLNPHNTVIDEIHNRYPAMTDLQIRSVLGSVLLSGESVFKPVGVISGGEKTKLSFALMMLRRANVLILDEPTNHLDISTKEVLEDALSEYTGTIIFVSHDRYLLNKIATRIVCISDASSKEYKGNRTKNQRALDVKKKQDIKELEEHIGDLETQIKDLEAAICDPETAADYIKMNELCQTLEQRKEELNECMDKWVEMQ